MVEDAHACAWTSQFELTQPTPLFAEIASQASSCETACDGEALVLPFGGAGSYEFWVDGIQRSEHLTALCPGKYDLLLLDSLGCGWQASWEVAAGPAFTLDLGADRWVTEGRSVEIFAQTSAPLASIQWAGFCEGNCGPSLTVEPQQAQWIQATAWSAGGCSASDSLWVEVRKPLDCEGTVFAPNAFTPNQDGLNDFFTLYADETMHQISQISRMVVYNRWGNIIFDRNGLLPNQPHKGWDGYSQGLPMQEGNYAWAAEFLLKDGSSFSCSGNVVLLR